MQERRHVKTNPGEPNAVPEFTPHPVRKEDGGNVQMDDINIPLVAASVAFFGVLLAVTIVSLQAWFYHYQAWERESKRLPQGDINTPLGELWAMQRTELHEGGNARPPVTTAPAGGTTSGPATATAATQKGPKRIPIDDAIDLVMKEYQTRQ